MEEPPSRLEWLVDGYIHGHSPSESIAWASWTADYEDEQRGRRRSLPAGFVPAECEPRLVTRLRRIFGR